MESGYLASPLLFLVQVIFGIYTLLLMLRLLLQVTRANFQNPVSQTIVRLTAPVLKPLRRIVPVFRGFDTASLVAAWLVAGFENLLILAIAGYQGALLAGFPWAVPKLVALLFSIFIFSIIIEAILSWIPSTYGHPMAHIVNRLNSPIMNRVRRVVPSTSGLDLSPAIAIVGLIVLQMLVMPPLYSLFGVPQILQT